ncbi:MAG: hypothetical protein WDW38_004753 [Sanguina aurantia]
MKPYCAALGKWNGAGAWGKGSCKQFLKELGLLADSAANFFAAATEHLQQLHPITTDIDFRRKVETCHLWMDVVTISVAVQACLAPWPFGQLHSNSPLHNAVTSLVAWIFSVQVSTSASSSICTVSPRQQSWTAQVLTVLPLPLLCFTHYLSLTDATVLEATLALKSELLPTLLSLACELLRPETALASPLRILDAHVSCSQFLHALLFRVMEYVGPDASSFAWELARAEPLGPHVLEAAKLLLAAYVKHDVQRWHEWLGTPDRMMGILLVVGIRIPGQQIAPCTASADMSSSCSGSSGSSSSSGGGSSSSSIVNPNCVTSSSSSSSNSNCVTSSGNSSRNEASIKAPLTTTSDEALLLSLRAVSVLNTDSRFMVNHVISSPSVRWGGQTTSDQPLSASAVRCFRGMTHHVTLHTLLWMLHQQRLTQLKGGILELTRQLQTVCVEAGAHEQQQKRLDLEQAQELPPAKLKEQKSGGPLYAAPHTHVCRARQLRGLIKRGCSTGSRQGL